MLNRRDFLMSLATISLAQLISACSEAKDAITVMLLKDSIPNQVLGEFQNQLTEAKKLVFKPEAQLKNLFNLLEIWQNKIPEENKITNQLPFINKQTPSPASLVSLGDYWLSNAIKNQLIEPLDPTNLAKWQNLPQPWQKLVKRNQWGEVDDLGDIWGAPYRWGTTMIAYRRDKFESLGWTPKDWSDLWRIELKDRIGLLDQPREVIGLVLKKLGYSYNSPDLGKIPQLKSELAALQKQVKYYSSNNYLQPLILGDTWLAVGWSTDILPIEKTYSQIEAVIPQSGTALWADLWVKPKSNNAELLPIIQQWINFCWQDKAASQISLFTNAISPMILSMKSENIPKDILNNKLLLPEAGILEKSDFLLPLSPSSEQQYLALWEEIRNLS